MVGEKLRENGKDLEKLGNILKATIFMTCFY